MKQFRGSYTVLVTPFTEDGSAIDEVALRRLVNWQIKEGVPGLIPLGSTGEFLSVTDDERTQVVETVVKSADGRVPVIIGTAAEWTDVAVRYSREAERLGADGVLIVPPFYSSPTEDELFEHYRQIAESISIPIMLYNNPNTSNVDMTPTFIGRLAQLENVLYVKESSGDLSRCREITRQTSGKVTVFAGYHAFDSMLLGADGWVSVCGNIVPRMSADLYNLAVTQQDVKAARDLYHRLLPLLDAIAGDLYVSATKEALRLVGMPVGKPRLPRLPLPPAQSTSMAKVLSAMNAIKEKAA